MSTDLDDFEKTAYKEIDAFLNSEPNRDKLLLNTEKCTRKLPPASRLAK